MFRKVIAASHRHPHLHHWLHLTAMRTAIRSRIWPVAFHSAAMTNCLPHYCLAADIIQHHERKPSPPRVLKPRCLAELGFLAGADVLKVRFLGRGGVGGGECTHGAQGAAPSAAVALPRLPHQPEGHMRGLAQRRLSLRKLPFGWPCRRTCLVYLSIPAGRSVQLGASDVAAQPRAAVG